MITFSNIVTVRDLLQDHSKGILSERYKKLIEQSGEAVLLKEEETKFIKGELDEEDCFLNNL